LAKGLSDKFVITFTFPLGVVHQLRTVHPEIYTPDLNRMHLPFGLIDLKVKSYPVDLQRKYMCP
jgi:hypothetical protein